MAPRTPKTKTKAPEQRTDGWANLLMGLGRQTRDKRTATTFEQDSRAFSREFVEGLWEGDAMIAKIIEKPAADAVRKGWSITVKTAAADTSEEPEDDGDEYPVARTDAFPSDGGAAPAAPAKPEKPPAPMDLDDEGAEKSAAVMARGAELRVAEHVREAREYERAFGGGAIILGVDDGQRDLSKPLDETNIKSFRWMNVLTRSEMDPVRWYDDPMAENYGKVAVWRVQADVSNMADLSGSSARMRPLAAFVDIHESRMVIFPGKAVSKRARQRNKGWGVSVVVRVLETVQDWAMSYAGTAHLVSDYAQAVMRIKGLATLVGSKAEETILARARLVDMTRSVARMVLMDSEEEFKRETTPLTGLSEILDKLDQKLSAVTGIPVSLLMGTNPGGIARQGDDDARNYYDGIASEQVTDIKPHLEKIYRLIMLDREGPCKGVEPEDWDIVFHPLWQMTEEQQATIRKVVAESDKIYIDSAVVIPEEVAASRFGGAKWSMETTLDMQARKDLAVQHEEDMAAFEEESAAAAEVAEDQRQTDNDLRAKEVDAKVKAAKKPAPKRR